ncbi:RIO-type serine/threonine-protein kinase Rio1 [uncultured archaeon]|nr:RIO-type serine/threonine-protein kinase Rio1 [uncultured archaeon]
MADGNDFYLSRHEKRGLKREKPRSGVEDRNVSEGVFDRRTLAALDKAMRRGFIDELVGIIATGKEANVYRGIRDGRSVAVKIYAVEAADFTRMTEYVRGDVRFGGWKNRRQLINTWAKKEYSNLMLASRAKVPCPATIGFMENILFMQFIGEKGKPAPRMKDSPPKNSQKAYDTTVDGIKKMWKGGLVHGDLSEYNILNDAEKPVFIDFSQGLLTTHPNAQNLLERDIANIAKYFRNQGVESDEKEILQKVTK